jgi:hypothetical protein
MSILSSVTSILELIKIPGIGVPREECKPTKPDDCGDGKQSKWNDDHKGRDDYSQNGDKDDYSKLSGKDDYSKHGKDDYSKDGKGDTYPNPGEALAKFDFSHGDIGSHGADHSGDIQGALASMSSDDALEYAIGQMGPADHFDDVGHFNVAADTSHDTDA